MILTKEQIEVEVDITEDGFEQLHLSHLNGFEGVNDKLHTYALAELEAGGRVDFHLHEGDSEMYYFLSGTGMYNDNGQEIQISPGTVTFTPSGTGHALKNTGTDKLVFMVLILKN